MKKIPLWKMKREMRRLGRGTLGAPAAAWEYLTLTKRYDANAARQREVYAGAKPLGAEVAIYLIYPSQGLLESHLDMLRHLNAHDISAILVSNLPLSPDALAALKPLCTRIIVRPNIGYDFGGYRDGVLSLSADLQKFDRLYLLNDSCWVIDAPLSWFNAVRDADVDFCSAASHEALVRPKADNFREVDWHYSSDRPRFHYASYALAMGSQILRDPKFLKFWRKIKLSQDKSTTIRRGEFGLTQWVLRQNCYSHAEACPTAILDCEIAALDDATLDMVARTLLSPYVPELLAKRDEILEIPVATPKGRADRIKIILAAVAAQGLSYALPFYTLKYRGFQFAKKSPVWLSQSGSDTMIALLDSLPGPMGRHAALEARVLRPDAWPLPAAGASMEGEDSTHQDATPE